jgi:uncharacterized membrane protein
MDQLVLQLVLFGSLLCVGGLLVIQPVIARRGLLFGVYVGEDRWTGPDAARITRGWYAGMAVAAALGIASGEAVIAFQPVKELGVLVAIVLLSFSSSAVYFRAYLQARKMAVPGTPAGAAVLAGHPRLSLALPIAALVFAAAGGIVSIAYAWLHFAELPASIPTHFGPSGRPDAWSPRSFWSVMLTPASALLIGTVLGTMACLVARAKRAVRYPDRGISVAAQQRFRQATAAFLAGTAILVTIMLTLISIFSIRSALGLAAGMPPALMFIVGALVVYAVGGSLYLAIRFGQGGARLERSAGTAPLTNGLADNSHWVLGMFYVNRDDPSVFVEKRFGLGYTINFGNRRALVLLAGFLVIVGAIVLIGILLPQTRVMPPR